MNVETELERLTKENQTYRDLISELFAALYRQAAFDDVTASEHLLEIGSYFFFDEPSAVKIARNLLKTIQDSGVTFDATSAVNNLKSN